MAAAKTTSKKKSRRASSKPEPVDDVLLKDPVPTQGYRVIRWIEGHCVHTKARWIGRRFKLLPWQKRLILELFEVDPETGLRRYRWALVGVPKKNGKTELAAAIALYFLIGDGEQAPDIPCAAASDEQADLVFGAAKTMCEMSPTLSLICEVYDKEILIPSKPGARLYRVAAVGGAGDGGNVFVPILDELHEWMKAKHETTWTVLTGGGGVREAPLVLQITTAGFDLDSICGREYEYGKKVQSGEIDDPTYFFRWYEPDPDDDWRDPETWAKCNPSLGVTVQVDYLKSQLRKKPRNTFERYYLNKWTTTEDSWLPEPDADEPDDALAIEAGGYFRALAQEGFAIEHDADVVLSVDLGLKKDTAAVDVLTVLDDFRACQVCDEGVIDGGAVCPRCNGTGHVPAIGVEAHVFDPSSKKVDYSDVENLIRELAGTFNVDAVVFDPWRFGRSAELLSDEGLIMVEFPMTNERTVKATDRLYKAIVDERRIVHAGDPILRAHVEAGALKDTDRGPRLAKGKTRRAIDALIALMIGLPTIDELGDHDFGFEA